MEQSTENSTVSQVSLVPQPHGGALNSGGTPGNKGGRPPSKVRAKSRREYYEQIPTLVAIAKDEKEDSRNRIAAIRVLGTLGLSGSITMDDVRERVRKQVVAIRELVTDPELQEAILQRCSEIWR